MNYRVSELENEEVDYLRFDRIKIQRKRMEHILEVIKDLTFKNKQLLKQTAQLRQQLDQDKHYKQLYEEMNSSNRILVQKNIQLSDEIKIYRQTALNQQLLINQYKEELDIMSGYRNNRYAKDFYQTEPQINIRRLSPTANEKTMFSEEYQILKAQYEDLQHEYSRLFLQQYSSGPKEKENLDLTGHIYCSRKQNKGDRTQLRKAKSSKMLDFEVDETINMAKLKDKYDRLKKYKKQLSKQLKIAEGKMQTFRSREATLLELIDLLKDKRTKICRCHINKLEKQLQLKSLCQGIV